MDVTIWRIRLDAGPDDEAALAPEERERARAFRNPADAARFRRARTALRVILARATGGDPAALRFVYGANGKPRLAAGDLGFSVSRSRDLAAIAVCPDAEVGVDCEYIADEPPDFYRDWTRLEASTKLHGRALASILAAGGRPDPADTLVDVDFAPGFAAALATHSARPYAVKDLT